MSAKRIILNHYASHDLVEGKDFYTSNYPWPDEFFLQGGEEGLVISPSKGNYYTAFVEVLAVETFIRGEGETVPEAEKEAWEKYQKVSRCDHPAYESRGYTNGGAFCVSCKQFKSKHYTGEQLGQFCHVCKEGTTYGTSVVLSKPEREIFEVWVCEAHYKQTGEQYLDALGAYPESEQSEQEKRHASNIRMTLPYV